MGRKAISQFPIGTRVRLKTRTIFGWQGCATLLEFGRPIRDGTRGDRYGDSVDACDHEWAVLRDQTPNPEHTEAVAAAHARYAEAMGEGRVGCTLQ